MIRPGWLLLLLLVGPTAAAQAAPQDACVRRCSPLAVDVAGHEDSELNDFVFLYPTTLGQGTLTTYLNPREDVHRPTVRLILGQLCQQLQWTLGTVVPRSGLGPTARTDAWMPAPGLPVVGRGAELVLYARPDGNPVPSSISVDVNIREGSIPGQGLQLASGSIDATPAVVGNTWELRVPLTVRYSVWFSDHEVRRLTLDAVVCSASTPYAGTSPLEFSFVHSPRLPARLVLQVSEPIKIQDFSAGFSNRTLVARAEILPRWGAYDLNETFIWLYPARDEKSMLLRPVTIDAAIHHDDPNRPVTVVFQIPQDELPVAKKVTLAMLATNLQGSFSARSQTTQEIVRFDGTATPVPSAAILIVALVVLAGALRSRLEG